VAAEHAASHAVLRRLAAAFEAAGTPRATEGAIVVGLPPGSRHELGSLIFAVAARRAGLPVLYVGADLPAEGWLSATTSAAAAVIGVTTTDDLGPARTVAARLKKGRPSMIVALGGPAAQALPGTLQLPEDLPAAVGRLAEAVRARNERSSLSG
jgi:methanogenic corrinoid protein MtbC1